MEEIIMENITMFLNQIAYYVLEIVKAIGEIAGEISAIHFPPIA